MGDCCDKCGGENKYTELCGRKAWGKGTFGSSRSRRQDNVKRFLKLIGWAVVDCILLAQDG